MNKPATIMLSPAEVQALTCLRRRGYIWRRKDGTGTPMPWSATLINEAGGLEELAQYWEPELEDL